MSSPAAVGSQILFALGRESKQGVPGGGTLVYHRPVPEFSPFLVGNESPGVEMNANGFMEPGVPGPISGPLDVGIRVSPGHLLEAFEALGFEQTKTTLESGFYNYAGSPSRTFVQSLYGLYVLPPVERAYLYGALLSGINVTFAANGPLVARLQGQIAHGSRMGPFSQESGTGTLALLPWLRGLLLDPTAGRCVSIKITDDDPLTIKVEQHDEGDSPTFGGSAVTYVYDSDGDGAWMNLQGDDGLDLGSWAENKDPLELLFPGDATAHADTAANDVFKSTLDWDDPSPTYLTGQRFTLAHLILRAKPYGASDYTEYEFTGGNMNVGWPVEAEHSNGSRYPQRITRHSQLSPMCQLVRPFSSMEFRDLVERHKRLDVQIEAQGAQYGSGAYRTSLMWSMPYAAFSAATRKVGNAGIIQETLQLRGETPPSGAAPVTVRLRTDRSITPSTGL